MVGICLKNYTRLVIIERNCAIRPQKKKRERNCDSGKFAQKSIDLTMFIVSGEHN